MKKIRIVLGENSHFVYAGYPIEKIGERLSQNRYGKKVILLTDSNVFPLYGEKIKKILIDTGKEVFTSVIKPGEKSKNLNQVYKIIEECTKNKMSRDSSLLTLGGGVVSDLGGFASSIYMRGINYISVPTSLLAQVDAAIGGKTGVNLPLGKNLIGSFYQPSFIYVDFNTLSTLPEREIKQGFAEIIKYGIIKSKKIFSILNSINGSGKLVLMYNQMKGILQPLIEESIMIKKDVVEKDEKEKKGLREILNFGHTLGHAIEISYLSKMTHGEAVALGMVGESYLSYKLNFCKKDVYLSIRDMVKKFGLPFSFSQIRLENFIRFLIYDKKVKDGRIRFVLVKSIGGVKSGVVIGTGEIKKILKELR
jgi:3-dehydroquinate synthase